LRVDGTIPVQSSGIPVRGLRVEVVEGPDKGKVQVAEAETISIGTGETNNLILTDPTVSRYHADLIHQDAGILVVDHGSTNGTLLSGARLERAVVPPRTVLKIGRSAIRIDDGETVTVETFEGEQLGGLVGRSPMMKRLMARIERAAQSETSILLLGETGTGKEVIASAIHEASARRGKPLETVDCGAMLPTLIASELFGHEKGAFTGADHQHIGAFERADGGTLFLDEIGELPPSLQTALLGALERRSFRRVGGKSSIAVDVRVIAATHRDLRGEVNTGTFRQDLFYRLAVIVLQIPALRERREDVPLLAEHFVRLTGYDGPLEDVLPEKTMEMLQTYWWPGNVRELRNMVEAAVVMGEAPSLSERGPEPERSTPRPAQAPGAEAVGGDPGQAIPVGQVMTLPYSEARNVVIDHFEDLYLGALLERCRGNVALAARQAKMNRSYLTRMIKRRGIERP